MKSLLSISFLCLICLLFVLQPAFAADSFRQRAGASEEVVAVSEDDVKAELHFGREIAARILGRYRLYENEELTKYINLIGKSLAANAGRPEIEYRFGILQADFPNAYAAPGGYIFITTGVIDAAEDEAELAGVLAHEVAHVTNKHMVKELNIHASDDSPASGVARLLGASGDPAKVAFLKATDKAMEILFENGYKKEDELDADRTGTSLLALSGYDPTGLRRFLDRILKSERKEESKSYPASSERLDAISGVIDSEGLADLTAARGKERFDAYKNK